jgi:hypothetical protein
VNGIHDMGGLHGFGRVEIERDEPVFHRRWEARVFGMVQSLAGGNIDAGRHAIERLDPLSYRFEWEEFRQRLIGAIGAWEVGGRPEAEWSYWRCWQTAFEGLLAAKGLCDLESLERRTRALTARAPGHDHAR